jgi:NADPH-dependent glutamate synthase beta subunit-like oxidoreductase
MEETGGWQRPTAQLTQPTGRRLAVVGAGPAGLVCAHYLARLGHQLDVFEKAEKPGGILSRAIPAFRLSEQAVEREIAALTLPGMRFRFGEALGRDFGVADLERDYDAVFLAPGLGSGRRLALPGLEQANASDALSLLERLRAREHVEVGESVVVIGGGSVASDAALCLRELGAARAGPAAKPRHPHREPLGPAGGHLGVRDPLRALHPRLRRAGSIPPRSR